MRLQTPKPLPSYFAESDTLEVNTYLFDADNTNVIHFSQSTFSKINSGIYKLVANAQWNDQIIENVAGVKIVIGSDELLIYYDYKDTVYKYEDYTLNATINYKTEISELALAPEGYEVVLETSFAHPATNFSVKVPSYVKKSYVNINSGYSAPLMKLIEDYPITYADYLILEDKYPIVIYATTRQSSMPGVSIGHFNLRDLTTDIQVKDAESVLANFYIKNGDVLHLRDTDLFTSDLIKSKYSADLSNFDMSDFVIRKRVGESKLNYQKDFLKSYSIGKDTLRSQIDKHYETYVVGTRSSSRYQVLPNYEVGNLIISPWYYVYVRDSGGRPGTPLRRSATYVFHIYLKEEGRLVTLTDSYFRFLINYDLTQFVVGDQVVGSGGVPLKTFDGNFDVELFGSKYKLFDNILINDNLL